MEGSRLETVGVAAITVAVVGALLPLFLSMNHRKRAAQPFRPATGPTLRWRLPNLSLVRSGNITVFGVTLGVALLIGAGLASIFFIPQRLAPASGSYAHADRLTVMNDVRDTLLKAVAGLGAIVAAVRTWLAVNERGQITERFTRATEQLASVNLEGRLASIFALEQIARDSDRDREVIGEILSGYVRSMSPWPPVRPGQYASDAPIGNVPPLGVRSADVQAAMTVLGRGLFARDLYRGLQLADVDLRRAVLASADLQGAFLRNANLQEADLRYANLKGASLNRALLQGAGLVGTNLESAELREVNLEGASLQGAELSTADLRGARLGGANLVGANLRGVQADHLTEWPAGFDPTSAGVSIASDTTRRPYL